MIGILGFFLFFLHVTLILPLESACNTAFSGFFHMDLRPRVAFARIYTFPVDIILIELLYSYNLMLRCCFDTAHLCVLGVRKEVCSF